MTGIAVTGASGFLGLHVLSALSGTQVIAHARTPRPAHAGTARPRWIHFDLGAPPGDAFDRLGRPDILIHLAWEGLPNYRSPRHLEVELPAQARFLKGLIASGLSRLVVAGTCFEYGMQSGCLSEDMTPNPSTSYAQAKDRLRGELESVASAKPFDLRWLRLFYLYGQGQSPTSLYAQFCGAVERGDRTFDMSGGEQVRDFMPAAEAGAAIAAAALAPAAPRILNVCSGAPVKVRHLVERWRSELAADIELNLGAFPYPSHEPFEFWGDDRRLRDLLGRAPVAFLG